MNKIIEKKDESYAGTVVLRCDDRCCSLVVDKFQDDEAISYNLSIQDSSYKLYSGFLSRVKRA